MTFLFFGLLEELYWLVDSQQVFRGNPRPFFVDAELVCWYRWSEMECDGSSLKLNSLAYVKGTVKDAFVLKSPGTMVC